MAGKYCNANIKMGVFVLLIIWYQESFIDTGLYDLENK